MPTIIFSYGTYEGAVRDNIRHGLGEMTYLNGLAYYGRWKDDQMHGYGKLYLSQNAQTVYSGLWLNNKMANRIYNNYAFGQYYDDGPKGIFVCNNGEIYYGKWERKTFENNDFYEGVWENDTFRLGLVQVTYSNCEMYKGEWKDGQRHGQGKMIYNNGVYNGMWKYGLRHGQGKMTYHEGEILEYEGVWENDKRRTSGDVKITYRNNEMYEGKWRDGYKHGQGIMTYQNGDSYDGMWENDKRHGKGIMTYQNGDSFDGMWENDQKVSGKLTNQNGFIIYERQWNRGTKEIPLPAREPDDYYLQNGH